MANMKSLPTGALASRPVLAGTPIRSGCTSKRRQDALQTRAISAPERTWEMVDKAEEARLHETDAFAELVNLSKQQSVNRPQKVVSAHMHDTSATEQYATIIIMFKLTHASLLLLRRVS